MNEENGDRAQDHAGKSVLRFHGPPRWGKGVVGGAAIIAGGHCGFGLGATPTAVANMQALTRRFGPSPQAFLVVPLTGAFFIDLLNAAVIQGYLSLPIYGF